MMPGRDDETMTRVLGLLPSNVQADARISRDRFVTMRFANGRVHQPHFEMSAILSLRVAIAGRMATATGCDLSVGGLRSVVAEAISLAKVAPKEPRFIGFAGAPESPPAATDYSRSTGAMSPEEAGKVAEAALAGAESITPGARIAGVINVGAGHLTVGSTRGLLESGQRSVLQASVLVERPELDPPVSGWAEGASWTSAGLDAGALGREAAEKVARSTPRSAKPGKYRVVLAGAAVAELVGSLGYLGFGGHAEEEGWSCLAKKRGRRVVAPTITVVDDARSPNSIPTPIDFEGLPKRATPLITQGIAAGPVTDLLTASRLGGEPTGHGLPPESPWGEWGPVPMHQVMSPGDADLDELVKETKNGILVTRFHYVRVVHPGRSEITGMTRDGTYQISKGEVSHPLMNLRFTQSVLGTFAATHLVGRERRCFSDERGFSSATCPAIAATGFRFTSATVF